MMKLEDRAKRFDITTSLWQSEIHSPNVVLSLACCPMDVEMGSNICGKKNASASTSLSHGLGRQNQFATDEAREHTMNEAMNGEYSTEHRQDGDVSSAMTEEFTSSVMGVSENGREPKLEAVAFKDWPSMRSVEKNHRDMERMERGIRVVAGSGGESDGCENIRRYLMSMEHARKLPSSQYKGVVPQPNGRWGAQIYEKHQRVWLGTFNKEEDAARAYDRAALKCRGQEAMINFSPARVTDLEARFMGEYNKEEIVDMLRKHTFDEEFEYYRKRIMMIAARSVAMNNAEVSGSKCSGQRAHVCQENPSAFDGSENAATSGAAKKGLPREHLFDKAVTPSDVGKLNRIVIPKNHAEKYFPVDVNTSKKGLLLSFEDDTGKVWRFRYSYWNSSQSYVLTKGWSRFVKDKKLEAGDIVSFHGGSAQACKLYISWRLNPLRQLRFGLGPQSHQSKGALIYPGNILSSLNPFDSGAQALGVYNTQWMPPLINRVGHVVAEWSQSPATRLNGTFPFYLSEPPTKQTYGTRFYEINTDGFPTTGFHVNLLHNSLNSGDESTNIESVHPFVNCAQPSMAQELETPGHKAASSLDPATKKGVRIFGVTLTETQKSS